MAGDGRAGRGVRCTLVYVVQRDDCAAVWLARFSLR